MASVTQSDPSGRWVQAILKLTKLTREGRITWNKVTLPTNLTGGIFQAEGVFEASYDNQRLRLRRNPVLIQQLVSGSSKPTHTLEIVDAQRQSIWTFPVVDALADLYQAAQYYQSGVGSFIDRLLEQP